MLVDGFIVSVAALLAVRLRPACRAALVFSHRSAEPGHTAVLEALDALEDAHEDSLAQASRFDAEIRDALNEIERGEYADYSQEELSRVFKRARAQGLELLAKTHPHKVPDADVSADTRD